MLQVSLPTDMNLMRIIAQGVIPSLRAASAVEAVRKLLAAQAQNVSAWAEAMALRSKGNPRESSFCKKAEKMPYSPELIRSRPMRGTLHVSCPEDYHLLRLACHRISSYSRENEKALGIDDGLLQKAFALAEAGFRQQAALTRDELQALWAEAGLLQGEQQERKARFLFNRMDREGLLAQGYVVKNIPFYVVVKDLPRPNKEAAELRLEIAARYAYSRGPVQADDLARWAEFSIGNARKALWDAVEASGGRLSAGRLSDDGKRLLPDPDIRRDSFFLRSDLWDLLPRWRRSARRKCLLPPFDALHNDYKNRSCLCDAEGELLICPSKNGTNRSIVMENGRLVAVYHKSADRLYALPEGRV